MTSVLVADDHPAVVEAVAEVLAEHGIEIAGRARDGSEAVEQIEQRKPTVALLDLRMPRHVRDRGRAASRRSAPDDRR